jgi:hypothetical protein
MQRQSLVPLTTRLSKASDTRAPRLRFQATIERLTAIRMSAGRWLVAVGLGVAIALSVSPTAFARVNVPPGDSDGGAGDGGAPDDPPPAADPRLDTAPAQGGVWQHAHGSSANTGFSRVDTAPAASHRPFTYLGAIAPGANPVVGPNGDVYIGNLQGELRAFHADGTPFWTRKINGLQGGFFAAPVVGADGSIYAVSSVHFRDHRDGETRAVYDSYLHKFSPNGVWAFWKPFPSSNIYPFVSTGATTAPPNVWRWNGTEAIIVPMVYKGLGGQNLRLIAFSTAGAVLGDKVVTYTSDDITTSLEPVWLAQCFAVNWWNAEGVCAVIWLATDATAFHGHPNVPLPGAGFPRPGVAIRPDPQGGAPLVMVTDGRRDKFAYAFSPQSGFSQVARSTHTTRTFTTPPVVQGNGNTVTGTLDGYLTYTARDFAELAAVRGLGTLTAAPTRLADGRLVVISREGRISVLSGGGITWQLQLVGQSIAAAAASCTHFFVSTTDEFVSFDVKTMLPVAKLIWVGGGLSAPVIGSGGYVYAIASDSLFVFAPPLYTSGITACDSPTTTRPGGGVASQ